LLFISKLLVDWRPQHDAAGAGTTARPAPPIATHRRHVTSITQKL
jgi:hypothetical protein